MTASEMIILTDAETLLAPGNVERFTVFVGLPSVRQDMGVVLELYEEILREFPHIPADKWIVHVVSRDKSCIGESRIMLGTTLFRDEFVKLVEERRVGILC